jgi:hypothetical protein
MVSVPSVLHKTLSSARSSVGDEGLKLKVTARVFTVTWLPNTVLSQQPDPDTEVAPGTVVSLTLSKAPACHPSYEGACLKPFVGDYDCAYGPGDGPNFVFSRVTVVGPDVYTLDKDHDGFGCDQLLG